MTALMRCAYENVSAANRAGRWYRATTSGERVSLAYLVDHGLLVRRAWRGDGFIGRDAAFEYATHGSLKIGKVTTNCKESTRRDVFTPPKYPTTKES